MTLSRGPILGPRSLARAAVVFVSAVLACSPAESTGPGASLNSVELVAVNPASSQLGVGSTLQLKATALDRDGNELTGRQTFWASGDTTIATVSSSGLVTGRAVGNVQIQAAIDGKPAYSFITVVARPVATITVAPSAPSLSAGGSVQLEATVKDDQGNTLTDRPLAWLSSNDAVARVTSTGLVLGSAPGTATITAAAEGKTGTATVTVTGTVAPPGPTPPTVARVAIQPSPTASVYAKENIQFTVTAFDAANNVITGLPISLVSSDPTKARVLDAAEGKVRGESPGTVTITATVGGKSASTALTVSPKPARTVSITPSPASVNVGAEVMLTAKAFDSDGVELTDRSFDWSSVPATAPFRLAEKDANTAVVNGLSPGSLSVTASVEGESVSGSTFVTVNGPSAPPPNQAPVAGFTATCTQLTCTFTDASTDPDGTVSAWSWSFGHDSATSAERSPSHTYPAAGNYTVTLTVTDNKGATNSASRTVTTTAPPPPPPVVASVVVGPAATITVGQTHQLTATARAANGAAITGVSFTWSSSNSGVASVSGTGLVTAAAAGAATITATATGGVAGSTTITVNAPPATSPVVKVEVTPPSATVVAEQTLPLTAAAYDATGAPVARTIVWTSANPGVATVSTTGVVTGVAAGSTTVKATADGVSGSATITVLAAIARVEVAPTTATIKVDATQQFTATPYDAAGGVLTGRTCTWIYNKGPGQPIISLEGTTGLVRGKNPGTASLTAACEGKTANATVTVTN